MTPTQVSRDRPIVTVELFDEDDEGDGDDENDEDEEDEEDVQPVLARAPPWSIQHARQIFDMTGQVAPPAAKPRVKATHWKHRAFLTPLTNSSSDMTSSTSGSYWRRLSSPPSTDKGKQPQVVDQSMSNKQSRSMPTTRAITLPGRFARLVPPDLESITNARVSSIRELASSPTSFPSFMKPFPASAAGIPSFMNRSPTPWKARQSMRSIDNGKQPQVVDQSMSNKQSRSMPTTRATTQPRRFAQHVAPDPEPITNTRVSSARELASSPTSFPSFMKPTHASHRKARQSMRSIDKGKQPQIVDQSMSNKQSRSMPTTRATTQPRRFAQHVASDLESITNARVSSARELASSPTSFPSFMKPTHASHRKARQSMRSIDKGKQPQVVDQFVSNKQPRSMPTTRATTQPRRFAQHVAPDPESITNARVSSARELASSATVSPAPPPLTTCDSSQSSHPSARNSPRITTMDPVHGPSNFPVLGLPSIRVSGNTPSLGRLSPPLQSHPQGPSPTSTALSGELSPTVSDTSSVDWTKDGQDPALLRLISVSCSILLRAYLKLAEKTVPSESEQQDVDGPKQRKDRFERQQSSQSTTNSHKRKQNSSRDESDDGNDRVDSKRQRFDSKGPAGFDVRPLACPFNKYDNRLFGPESPDDAYHVCATCSFVSIAHLKQHLQRNHYLPRYFCFRCCRRNFSSQAMLASHQREQPMCETLDPPLYRERIGSDLIEELGLDRKNLPGTDRVDYWHKVYDTFFPGAAEARPVSPYYEGPAAEHLRRFLHFSERALEGLLPVVQQRLGLQGTLSPNSQLRLQQEIQQEAGQRYLQHIASSSMPHLGRPLLNIDANMGSNASQNPVSQTDPSDSGGAPSRPVAATLDLNRVNVQVAPSNGSAGSMTTTSDVSSPSFPRTPTAGLSTQLDSQTRGGQLNPSRQIMFGPAFGGGPETGGLGAPSQNVGGDIQSLHFLNTEQLGDPVDWFDLVWESEIEAAMAFDCELPLTKDLNDTSMGRCERGPSTWEE